MSANALSSRLFNRHRWSSVYRLDHWLMGALQRTDDSKSTRYWYSYFLWTLCAKVRLLSMKYTDNPISYGHCIHMQKVIKRHCQLSQDFNLRDKFYFWIMECYHKWSSLVLQIVHCTLYDISSLYSFSLYVAVDFDDYHSESACE